MVYKILVIEMLTEVLESSVQRPLVRDIRTKFGKRYGHSDIKKIMLGLFIVEPKM